MILAALKDDRSSKADGIAVALIERFLAKRSLPHWTAQSMGLVLDRFRRPHDLGEKKPEDSHSPRRE